MKHSKTEVHWKARALPEIRFEDQQLTSFAGLVVFQPLFERLGLKSRLRGCFDHLTVSPIFGHASIVMLLIVRLLIGYRRLSDLRYYQDDPMVKRTLGLKHLPDVATVSCTLDGMDKTAVRELRRLHSRFRRSLVHRLHRYFGGIRLLGTVHQWLRLFAFPMRTGDARRSAPRSPGSQTRSVHACQGLRPRRVIEALALARLAVLPST